MVTKGGSISHYPSLTPPQSTELSQVAGDGNRSAKEVHRAQAILMLEAKIPQDQITQLTGLKRRRVFKLRREYVEKGIAAILDQRIPKAREILTKAQRLELALFVSLNVPIGGWTTGLLAWHIKETYHVEYKSKTSFYLVFKQAKFTWHKPGRVYQQRDAVEVAAWEAALYPELQVAWDDPETVILCLDEMSLSSQTTVQKVWLPEGQYPLIEVSSKRESKSLFGYLNLKTGREHAFVKEWQNMYTTVETLQEIRKLYPTEKILLLLDQAGWHKGSKTREWIEADTKVSTFYFPRSAPDENPQEHVWKAGRSAITHNQTIPNIKKTALELAEYINTTNFPYKLLGFSALT